MRIKQARRFRKNPTAAEKRLWFPTPVFLRAMRLRSA
jgi:very-short-patch-repair endonuclease